MNVTTPRSTAGFLAGLVFVFSLLLSTQSIAATIAFLQGSESIVLGDSVTLEVTDPAPDSSDLIYNWKKGGQSVSGENGPTFSPDLTLPGTFTFHAIVLKPNGVSEQSNPLTIVVAYAPPTVSIDRVFVEGTNIVEHTNNGALQATAFSGDTIDIQSTGIDPDGGAVTYSWSADAQAPSLFVPGSPNTVAPTNGQDYTFSAPIVTAAIQLQLTVLVTDNETGSDQGTVSKTVVVTVRPKEAPVAVPQFKNLDGSLITGPIFFDPAGGTLKLDGLASRDPDGGAIETYKWTPVGFAAALGDLTEGNPQVVTIPAFTETTAISYDLKVTDNEGVESGTVRGTVLLEPYLQPVITVNGSKFITIFSDESAVMKLDNIVDPALDGGSVSVNDWVQTGATGGTLNQANKRSVVFTPPNTLGLANNENSRVFYFTVSATDDDLNQAGQPVSNSESEPTSFTVTVRDRGRLPTPSFTVTLPTADAQGNYLESRVLRLEADGTALDPAAPGTLSISNHPQCGTAINDNGIVSYAWEPVSGAAVTEILPADFGVTDDDGSQFWFKARVPHPNAVVSIKLTITDCQNQVNSITVPITIVDDGNNAVPIAKAGNDISVVPGATITLSGANSTDPDGSADIETYKWEQTSGADVGIVNSDQSVATATAPAQDATLIFTLTLTDKTGATSSDQVIVNVSETNVSPTAVAIASPSQAALGATVSLSGSQSSDPEGGALRYSWTTQTPGVTINAFSSENTTAIMPSSGQQGVEFQLEVTDDRGAKSTARTIVNVGSGIPPSVNAGGDKTVKEGDLVTLRGSAADPDGADSAIVYTWRLAGGLNVTLDNPAIAEPNFVAPFVLQNKSTTFELVATDESGFKAVDSVTITIEDNGITGFNDGFVTRNPVVEDNITVPSPIGFKVTGGDLVYLRPVSLDEFSSTDGKPSELPYGLWEYRIKGANPTLEVQFDGGAPNSTKWFNFSNNSWAEFKDEDGNSAVFDSGRDIVSLALRDGSSTDQGGTTTDGFVTGVGGLGSTAGATTRTTGGRSQLGGGGSLGLPMLLIAMLGLRRRYRSQLSR